MRHVGLVALEALLVAVIVWVAAMTLAGATQSEIGIGGAAEAGRAGAHLAIANGVFGGTTAAHASPGGPDTWVHAICSQGGVVASTQWVRVDARNDAILVLGPTSTWSGGAAACSAEEGYFGGNSRWRVQATASFAVTP